MTEVVQTTPAEPPAPQWWHGPLTLLIAFLGIAGGGTAVVLLVWGLVEDAPVPQGPIRPKVFDDAHLLTAETVSAIESTAFPPDVPVIVRTVDRLDAPVVAAAATDWMERETWWRTVRPRTWHQRAVKRNTPWGSGIYILVSKQPALMQVRFGEHIRLEAYRAGLAAGTGYRRHQEAFSLATADTHIRERVLELSRQVPLALNLPWYLRYTKTFASVAFSEIEEFVLPAEGAFRQGALRTYTSVLRRMNAAASGWRFVAFTAVTYVVLWLLMHVVPFVLGTRFGVVGWIAGVVTSVTVQLGFLVGAIASLLLLGNGRQEDAMLLRDLGLGQIEWASFGPDYLSAPGGWVLVLTTAFVALVRGLLDTITEFERARAEGETRITFGFITAPACWGALVLFLPRAMGLFALFHQIATLFSSIVALGQALNRRS